MDRERKRNVGNRYLIVLALAICFIACKDEPKTIIEELVVIEEPEPILEFGFNLDLYDVLVDTIKSGSDITIVSYGSTLRIVEEASKNLQEVDIDVEIIDIQSLIPFDIEKGISKSVKKIRMISFVFIIIIAWHCTRVLDGFYFKWFLGVVRISEL